jgi:hypothetical protein
VAIVYPAAEAAADDATAETVEAGLRSACFNACRSLEPHERVDVVRLTDAPLPATPLGKLRRKEIPSTVAFDLARWRETLRGSEAADPN